MALRKAMARWERWEAAVREGTTAVEEGGFHADNAFLLKTVPGLRDDAKQLARVVQRVERSRRDFPDIDDAELARRKEFLGAVEETIRSMAGRLSAPDVLARIKQDAENERRRKEAARRAELLSKAEQQRKRDAAVRRNGTHGGRGGADADLEEPVSYTHLTLPTICSV